MPKTVVTEAELAKMLNNPTLAALLFKRVRSDRRKQTAVPQAGVVKAAVYREFLNETPARARQFNRWLVKHGKAGTKTGGGSSE